MKIDSDCEWMLHDYDPDYDPANVPGDGSDGHEIRTRQIRCPDEIGKSIIEGYRILREQSQVVIK